MSKTDCSATYDRVPSERLQQLLAPEGFLAPLLRKRKVEGIGLEAHLRPKKRDSCLLRPDMSREDQAERKRGHLGRIAQDIRQ